MTAVQFAYWLQGFFELAKPTEITKDQIACIKAHLDLTFLHDIDNGQDPVKQAVHDGLDPKVIEELKKTMAEQLKPFRPKPGDPKQIRC